MGPECWSSGCGGLCGNGYDMQIFKFTTVNFPYTSIFSSIGYSRETKDMEIISEKSSGLVPISRIIIIWSNYSSTVSKCPYMMVTLVGISILCAKFMVLIHFWVLIFSRQIIFWFSWKKISAEVLRVDQSRFYNLKIEFHVNVG